MVLHLIYALWYFPTYVTYTKILPHVSNHIRRFYGNCRTQITPKDALKDIESLEHWEILFSEYFMRNWFTTLSGDQFFKIALATHHFEIFHKPKCNCSKEIDKLQSYRIFWYAKWSILITNIDKSEQNKSRRRSSRSQMIFKISALKDFPTFIRKHLCWGLFLITLLAWSSQLY